MSPHTETFLDVLATSAAALRREARRHSNHHMTSSLSLLREDVEERAPTGVMNAFGEVMITRHPCHIQVFDTNAAIPLGILFGRLEEEVAPLAANLEMLYRDLAFRLTAAVTPLLAAVADALGFC